MTEAADGETERASAIDKAFRIIRAFDRDDTQGMGVSELARRARLPKSTSHRVLSSLIENGAVQRVGDRYRLGPLFFDRGPTSLSTTHELVAETLTPFLAALFERTRCTVHLAYLDGADVVYANKLFSVTGVSAPSRIGGRVPGHCTGVGKAMMAYDESAIDLAISRGLVPWSEFSVTGPASLRAELAVVRQTGLAYDVEEATLGLSCVAAPVWGKGSVPGAAMSVSGPVDSFRPQDHVASLKKICESATRAFRKAQRTEE